MNDLETFFRNRKTDDIHKWSNYFELYDRYFSPYRGKPVHFLEIGVDRGGSSMMWKHYFGKDALVVGVDINPDCKQYQKIEENCFIEIGDQNDPDFLNNLGKKYQYFDIILDDGSHQFEHQKNSLRHLWKYCSEPGLYLIEDTMTSYYPDFVCGIKCKNTFIEYTKDLIDELYSCHRFDSSPDSIWASSLHGIHFHCGMVILEKGMESEPYVFRSGPEQPHYGARESISLRIPEYVKNAHSWRIVLWHLKRIFYLMAGDTDKRTLYANSLHLHKIFKTYLQKGDTRS